MQLKKQARINKGADIKECSAKSKLEEGVQLKKQARRNKGVNRKECSSRSKLDEIRGPIRRIAAQGAS